MRSTLVRSVLLGMALPVAAAAQAAAPSSAPTGGGAPPAVGDVAPDFTASSAGREGISAEPVTLSKLRGKVVVLAFYPADRTSGCTAEMTKFRDDYAKLFGSDVVVLPISRDNLESHASWAKEMNMPFALVSDTTGTVARLYGSEGAGKYFTRNVFVVGKDGKIAYTAIKFSALSEDAYTALGEAVAKAKG